VSQIAIILNWFCNQFIACQPILFKMAAAMYCSEQINIPPELPEILKQFTKSAIRSQPSDLAAWAAKFVVALNF
jgi:hypothetical protein